jgi:hypothetical protein
MRPTAPVPAEQPQVRSVSELEGLVGDDVSAGELVRLRRVDALLRSAVRATTYAAPKPSRTDPQRGQR